MRSGSLTATVQTPERWQLDPKATFAGQRERGLVCIFLPQSNFWKISSLTYYRRLHGRDGEKRQKQKCTQLPLLACRTPMHTGALQHRPVCRTQGGPEHKTTSTEYTTAPPWSDRYLRDCMSCRTEGAWCALSCTAQSSLPLYVLLTGI